MTRGPGREPPVRNKEVFLEPKEHTSYNNQKTVTRQRPTHLTTTPSGVVP